jgi:L-ribulose-5-phosphate 3-epimerase
MSNNVSALKIKHTRRDFVKSSLLGLGAGITHSVAISGQTRPSKKPMVCLFSKPLQALSCQELGEFCAELGVEGVDLTVRPEGHVLPETVETDLPAAARALSAANLKIRMITTAIVDADEPHTQTILKSASELGIRHIKLGYYHYQQFEDIPKQLALVRESVLRLGALCSKYGVQAGFHNHSGAYVGAALWDLREVLRDIPPDQVGVYFDAAHATVEGGDAGWKIGMNLLLPRIIMAAVKDFRWERPQKEAKSDAEFGPLGQGEVRWEEVFPLLKKAAFSGPISLHVEYTAAANNSRPERERMMKLMKQDLTFLKRSLDQSGLG